MTGCFGEEDLVGDLGGVEEMFMVVDDDEGEGGDEGEKGKGDKSKGDESKGERRERKVRRERERRIARGKVHEVVDGWRRVFEGGKGGKYFWVGSVVGAEWGGERRGLCKKARKARPRRGGG